MVNAINGTSSFTYIDFDLVVSGRVGVCVPMVIVSSFVAVAPSLMMVGGFGIAALGWCVAIGEGLDIPIGTAFRLITLLCRWHDTYSLEMAESVPASRWWKTLRYWMVRACFEVASVL